MKSPYRMRTTFEKSPNLSVGGSLLTFVFSSGGKTAPDMTFLFVFIKDLPNFGIQRRIVLLQSLL